MEQKEKQPHDCQQDGGQVCETPGGDGLTFNAKGDQTWIKTELKQVDKDETKPKCVAINGQ